MAQKKAADAAKAHASKVEKAEGLENVEKAGQPASIEQTFRELESLVSSLEGDQLSLEESLGAFEQGIRLIRAAQDTLSRAEQKVQLLLEQDGEPVAEPFVDEEDT